MNFRSKKSYWRQQCSDIMSVASLIFNRVQVGELPNMDIMWDIGDRIVTLGEQGTTLADAAHRKKATTTTTDDIAWVSRKLEICSLRLQELAQHLGMPHKSFPIFTSTLRQPTSETGLDDILETEDIGEVEE